MWKKKCLGSSSPTSFSGMESLYKTGDSYHSEQPRLSFLFWISIRPSSHFGAFWNDPFAPAPPLTPPFWFLKHITKRVPTQ
ncbi:hypothetical protein VNO77_12524 [Canavalia gladiata]|uniref:Uncharacterized protein n=1 Tax=Canavalia gladiata TaxID=3824 RepID=A0AAN9QR46_CANGL